MNNGLIRIIIYWIMIMIGLILEISIGMVQLTVLWFILLEIIGFKEA